MWEKIRNLFRIFLGNCGGCVVKKRSNNKSVCLSVPHIEEARAMYTPYSGFQMVNQNMKGMSGKEKWCWGILHGYMRKGKRPSHTTTYQMSQILFLPFPHMPTKLATLQPSIPSPGVEISQVHLNGWSQAPKPESGHLGRPSPPPPPLLFNILCIFTTYSVWMSF